RIASVMTEMPGHAGLGIEHIEPLLRANPNAAARIDEQRAHRIARQRVGFRRIVPELLERVGASIPASVTATDCREPQVAVCLLSDRPDEIARESFFVAPLAAIGTNGIAVVAIQAALRRK